MGVRHMGERDCLPAGSNGTGLAPLSRHILQESRRLLGQYRQVEAGIDVSERYIDAFVGFADELEDGICLFGHSAAAERLVRRNPERYTGIVDLKPEKKGLTVGDLTVIDFEDFKQEPATNIIITDVALQYVYLDMLYFDILRPRRQITVEGLWNFRVRYNYVLEGIAYGNNPEVCDYDYLATKKSLPMECTIPPECIIRLMDCVRTSLAVQGDILEVGTGEGGSTFFIASTLENLGATKTVYSVDGFEPQDYLPDLSYETVKAKLDRFSFVKLIKGYAPWILLDQPIKTIAFAFIDFYAMPAILEYVYPKVPGGGMILIDNYNHGCVHNHGKPIADSFFLDKKEKIIRVGNTQGLVVKQ